MTWDLIKGPSEAQHETGMLNLHPKVLCADPSSRPEFDVTRIRADLVVWSRGKIHVIALGAAFAKSPRRELFERARNVHGVFSMGTKQQVSEVLKIESPKAENRKGGSYWGGFGWIQPNISNG